MTKILCVDDEPKNLKLLEALLTPAGYEILPAESGEAALKKLTDVQVDLILLDIMMPGMNGFEVLEKLRSDEKTRLIPVVMVTALREVEDRVKALEAGCDDFLSKPFDKVELLSRVKSLLKISFYRRQLDEKEKFEVMLDEIADGALVLNDNFKIINYNRPALELLQIETAKIPDNLLEHLLTKFKVHYKADVAKDIKIMPLSFDVEREASEKFKELILEIKSKIVLPPDKSGGVIVLTLRNVTDIRKENRLKSNFLDVIPHKLRSAFTAVIGIAGMLDSGMLGKLSEQQQKAVKDVYEGSIRLNKIINRILDFVKLISGSQEMPKKNIEISKSINEVIKPYIETAKDKKIKIMVDCDEELKLLVSPVRFNLVIGNLVENAIKFCNKDHIDVEIAAKKVAGGVELIVSDNGPGMPPEDYQNIFNKFYQVEKWLTGNVPGVGLGLPIVKKLVEDCGGNVKLESVVGQGTKFFIYFPSNE